jgi:hypothetical protein
MEVWLKFRGRNCRVRRGIKDRVHVLRRKEARQRERGSAMAIVASIEALFEGGWWAD